MNRFIVPAWVKDIEANCGNFDSLLPETIAEIKSGLQRFHVENPEVSIVVPAWNEERNLTKTLASFSRLTLPYATELIIINNNSTDRTQEILDFFGVKSYFQPIQGISVTRQMGLEKANGKYILSADADSLYPADWGNKYIKTLKKDGNSIVYGRYSFIPSQGNRFWLAFYEMLAEILFSLRRRKKDFINVMGFNFAFKRVEALGIGGFNLKNMKWQDGYLALTISEAYGKIELVSSKDSRPWTSDRRLLCHGSLFQGFVLRIKKELKYLHELLPFVSKENVLSPPVAKGTW